MYYSSVLNEASTTGYHKKYKCPYCEQRFERQKLHIHIQNKHEDLIPEGYTALRVAFNTINHKTEGHCIICKGVTNWNEQKGRYERLCSNPKCHEEYKKMAAERNQKKYGTDRLQSDPRYAEEVQRKALANRRLAGKYKFPDGTEIPYMGTYEKKFLEFMDRVMLANPEDITAPGPSIEYDWNGQKHLYIPDFYYIPYNLIIEIKDGGDNPNKNPGVAASKLDRQVAKENAIRKAKQFNYIRLVNNEFDQLLEIMAVLKYNLQNECYDPVMRIHEDAMIEDMSGTIAAALPLTPCPIPYESDPDNYYIVQHPKNNTFAYGITKDPIQYTVYGVDPQEKGFYKAYKTDKKAFTKDYLTFKIKDKQKAKELYDELAKLEKTDSVFTESNLRSDINPNFIYSYLTDGNNIIEEDQLLFDNRFELVNNFQDNLNETCDKIYNYLMDGDMFIIESQLEDLQQSIASSDMYKVLPDSIDNIKDLEDWKNDSDNTSHYQRKVANDISISKYGQSNDDRYNEKKAILSDRLDPNASLNELSSEIEIHSNISNTSAWDSKLKAAEDAEATGLVILVVTPSDDVSINTPDNIMKDKWNKFLSLSQSQRSLSNNTALSIFGIDNYGLYDKWLNGYISNKLDREDQFGIDNKETFVAQPPDVDTAPTYQNTANDSTTSDPIVSESFNERYLRGSKVLKLMSELGDSKDDKTSIKEAVINLGWNPEIPFNEKTAIKRSYIRNKTNNIYEMAKLVMNSK